MKFVLSFFSLLFFTLNIYGQRDTDSIKFRAPNFVDVSVLSTGDIYKIPVNKTGIFKISYDYLKNLGIDIESIDANNIKLYGNGGGKLNQKIDDNYIDDLKEVPIYINGAEDGKINSGDFILFYGEGPNKWHFDLTSKLWKFEKNIYSNNNYYFLKISSEPGLRIKDKITNGNAQYVSDETDIYSVYEEDLTNLLGNYIKTEGSGQEWYGDFLTAGKEKDFSSAFNEFTFLNNKGLSVNIKAAARDGFNRTFHAFINDTTIVKNISNVSINNPESTYARKVNILATIFPNDNTPTIKLKYEGQSAWLDKIELNARTKINFKGNPMFISDKNAPSATIASFEISNVDQNLIVWEITDQNNISNIPINLSGNKGKITYIHNIDERFLLFSLKGDFNTPESGEKIENQNLHSINDADMLIVYHDEFEEAALKLKEHRMKYSTLNVYAISLDKIFNEFSCGKYDPTAIRDFTRMLKIKNDKFNYLLLFGDGSYDARGISTKEDNYIPVYETKQSLDPIRSYPSDDYFGLLSYGEGANLSGKVDIGVGRIPVNSLEDANIYVQKVINYETQKEYYGSWKNNITIVADDVDEEWDITHFTGAEKISSNILSKYPTMNVNKIYLDAFIQENNAGGQRYPDVNQAINTSIYNGDLMFVYVGHGGPKGLAQERVLQKEDIKNWNNKTKLPLLITATCSFTGFDDPAVFTAGEEAFLKKKGGVISLFSTVRAVYASSNDALMKSTFNAFFANDSNRYLPIGDIIKIAKNNTSDTENKRKFLLFGDPSLSLNFPEYNVLTTKINKIDITSDSISIDTLKALEEINLEGIITDNNKEIISDFNGEIEVSIYDKPSKFTTLSNDFKDNDGFKRTFYIQKNLLFRGNAEVQNGSFKISFILPKDINYNYGSGKISYYAIANDLKKASGYFNKVIIGGTSNNTIADNEGPIIDLYMNDTGFTYGGTTDSNPVLLGILEDASGINITGIGIGHDLSAEIDNSSNNKIILNDFYESELNNYKKGSFRYPLSNLSQGKHKIKVEAWDIYNNKSEKIIEFTVLDNNDNELKDVLNYPNPFSDRTVFRFEHNLPDQELEIAINIYSISGKLVKSIRSNRTSLGYHISDIYWDGTDDFGIRLGNGIYIYKIKVFSPQYNISKESKFEKLVILK